MRLAVFVCALLSACTALAQPDVLFGNGRTTFIEQDLDARFLKSKVNRALTSGTQDANCVQVLGGLFTALAEVAPTLHKRDENFYLDASVIQALNTQLTQPRFPATAYLAAMVRRVMIDHKLPKEWLQIAEQVNQHVLTIDVGKLRFLADGVHPIDSFLFTLPIFKERYDVEVTRANTLARPTAMQKFRDNYMDRDVAWGGLTFVDVIPLKRGHHPAGQSQGLIAEIELRPPPPPPDPSTLVLKPKKLPVTRIVATLAPDQYLDVAQLPKGERVMIRGRLWDMGKTPNEIYLKDALLFQDRDWSLGGFPGNLQSVAMCPWAVNELTGDAPHQPGGFGQHP